MCGIAGVANFSSEATESEEFIRQLLDTQQSRGPDFSQYLSISDKKNSQHKIVVGHNRLAIIDLSASANQPFIDASGRFTLVYNGMIYNYIEIREELIQEGVEFRTSSDTEVLLQALINWGIKCINKLNGMFSFALVDNFLGKIYLVRDRFGVKPLYYIQQNNMLAFASTTNYLSSHFTLKPNKKFLVRGLARGYYDDNLKITAYTNLYQVCPGQYIEYDYRSNELKISQYYDLYQNALDKRDNYLCESHNVLTEMTQHKLNDAVSVRLRSDVSLGVSISGGLDSCLISSLAAEKIEKVHAFHVGSPNERLSEGPLVDLMSKYKGINTHYLDINHTNLFDDFITTLDAQDAPYSSLSVVAQNKVFEFAKKQGIKVMLGGQGGDEAFMGYRKFLYFYFKQLQSNKQYSKMLAYLGTLLPTLMHELPRYKQYLFARVHYAENSGVQLIRNVSPVDSIGFITGGCLIKRQVDDILKYSLPTLLRYEDRNSMGNSIETRLPYLDYRLVEHALALPVEMKIAKGYGKWVLRKIAYNKIPEKIRLARYKRGFDVSTEHGVSSGFGSRCRSILNEKMKILNEFTENKLKLSDYSDEKLSNDRQKMKELIMLMWLARKL